MLDIYVNIGNTLSALESSLRIAISNADNFNSPGYKYSYASFTTVFNNVITSGMMLSANNANNPIATGASMTIGSTGTDFKQGNIGLGTALDVAISGEGFFSLSASTQEFGSGASRVFTRNGRFQKDFAGKFITDSFGRKVFGFKLDNNGNKVSDVEVPIETDGNTDVGFVEGGVLVTNFQSRKDAIANNTTPVPEQKALYKLSLTSFRNKQGLVVVDGGAYKATLAAGDPLPVGESGTGIYGDILQESLESSNIDVARVALDMALLNRGFAATQGIIDDVNKITNNLISKLTG